MGIYFSNPPLGRLQSLHYQSCVYIPVAMLAVSDKLCLKCSTVYYKQLPKFKFKNWSHLADVQNVQIYTQTKQDFDNKQEHLYTA